MYTIKQYSRCTVISTVSLTEVGMTKLSTGFELTLTRQENVVESATLSSGLMERVEMKEDWLPDWVVPEIAILGDDSNIPIGVRQVKSTITLISSTLVRLMVQMRSRAVPATMGTAGLTGWTTTVGEETGGRKLK